MDHSEKFLEIVNDAKRRVREISSENLKARMDVGSAPVIIDVREDREWDQGHLAGAIHLGKGIIERDIESKIPDSSTEIVLYCGGGFRSALAADELQKMRYTQVWSLAGGVRGWKEAGFDFVNDSALQSRPMLVHTVLFWLKKDLSQEQRQSFVEGLTSLRAIEHAAEIFIGTPADTGSRPVVDGTYDYALNILFQDMPRHDAYQVHPLHKNFLANYSSSWSRVVIYDAR